MAKSTRIEVSVMQVESADVQNLTCRLFLQDSLKSLTSPFSSPVTFEVKEFTPESLLVVSFERYNRELSYTEIRLYELLKNGPVDDKFQMTSKKDPMRVRLQVKEIALPTPVQSSHGKLDYMAKFAESQERRIECLQESQDSYSLIKDTLAEYYEFKNEGPVQPSLQGLGIQEPELKPSVPLTQQEAKHLQTVVSGLNEKIKGLQVFQTEARSLRAELNKSIDERVQLQESVQGTLEQMKETGKIQDAKFKDLIDSEAKTKQEFLNLQEAFNQKVLENEELNSKVTFLTSKIEELSHEDYNFRSLKERINSLTKELELAQLKREELRKQFEESVATFDTDRTSQINHIEQLQNDKKELLQKVTDLESALKNSNNSIEKLKAENLDQSSLILKLTAQVNTLQDENAELAQTRKIVNAREESATGLQENLHHSAKAFESELQKLTSLNAKICEEKSLVTEELNATQNTLENKLEQLQEINRDNLSLTNSTLTLEQTLVLQKDKEELLDVLENQQQSYNKSKDSLVHELLSLADFAETQTKKNFDLFQTVQGCSRLLQSQSQERHSLSSLVENLRIARPVYVPCKDDPLDLKIAEFLNDRDDWRTVSFCRLEPGLYALGSKNVQVFLQDDGLFVRLGQGVLPIQDFFKTYVPMENNKKLMNDPTTKRQQLVAAYMQNLS